MTEPFAEVIGDPIAHSLSPAIHAFWLQRLGLSGSYRATRCTSDELEPFLASRRDDPTWRGCNVTMPLKQQAALLLDQLDSRAAATGAVNCIVPGGVGLSGFNTDLDGVDAALGDENLAGRWAVVLGSGGAARAAVVALAKRGTQVAVLARKGPRSAAMTDLTPGLQVAPLYAGAEAFEGAAVIINATPLGMRGEAEMPLFILEHLGLARGALAIDMVSNPSRTEFLAAAHAAGLRTADGLTVLIGQARRAFELFFGCPPPPGDDELRARLTTRLPAG